MQTKLHISTPSLLFGCFLFLTQFLNGFTIAKTGGTLSINNVWYLMAFYWALGWWFIADSRREGIPWMDRYLDMGLFLYIGWVFLVPYYLFITRGWKALYTIGLFTGAFLTALIAGAISFAVINIFH